MTHRDDNPLDALADHALAEQRAGRTIPLDQVRRHYEITGHSFGGNSPYPISKPVGDTVLHPDGRVTPTPAPDAGHAAEALPISDAELIDWLLIAHTDAVRATSPDNRAAAQAAVDSICADLLARLAARPDGAR